MVGFGRQMDAAGHQLDAAVIDHLNPSFFEPRPGKQVGNTRHPDGADAELSSLRGLVCGFSRSFAQGFSTSFTNA
jgi:hypothetical protein